MAKIGELDDLSFVVIHRNGSRMLYARLIQGEKTIPQIIRVKPDAGGKGESYGVFIQNLPVGWLIQKTLVQARKICLTTRSASLYLPRTLSSPRTSFAKDPEGCAHHSGALRICRGGFRTRLSSGGNA